MLVDNGNNSNKRNKYAGYMQKPHYMSLMPVEPDIYIFPNPKNPVAEHKLGIYFEETINIVNMSENHKPVSSLQRLLRIRNPNNMMFNYFFALFDNSQFFFYCYQAKFIFVAEIDLSKGFVNTVFWT